MNLSVKGLASWFFLFRTSKKQQSQNTARQPSEELKKILSLIVQAEERENFDLLTPFLDDFHLYPEVMKKVAFNLRLRDFYFRNATAIDDTTVQIKMHEYALSDKECFGNLPTGLYIDEVYERISLETIKYMSENEALHLYLYWFLSYVEEGSPRYMLELKNKFLLAPRFKEMLEKNLENSDETYRRQVQKFL